MAETRAINSVITVKVPNVKLRLEALVEKLQLIDFRDNKFGFIGVQKTKRCAAAIVIVRVPGHNNVTVLIYSTGKFVFLTCKSMKVFRNVCKFVVRSAMTNYCTESDGVVYSKQTAQVVNSVFSYNTHKKMSLQKLKRVIRVYATKNKDALFNCEFDSEWFPGLRLTNLKKTTSNKAFCNIFGSGKVVITGISHYCDVDKIINCHLVKMMQLYDDFAQ